MFSWYCRTCGRRVRAPRASAAGARRVPRGAGVGDAAAEGQARSCPGSWLWWRRRRRRRGRRRRSGRRGRGRRARRRRSADEEEATEKIQRSTQAGHSRPEEADGGATFGWGRLFVSWCEPLKHEVRGGSKATKLGVSRGGGPGYGRAAAANALVGYGRCEYKPGRWPTASCALRAADTATNGGR